MDTENAAAMQWRRKRRTMHRLAQITEDIKTTYQKSRNLKREVREAQNSTLNKMAANLRHGACDEVLDEYADLLSWGADIGQVLFELEAQRGFSGELVSEMEMLQGGGMQLVQRWCDNEPLNLSEEELQLKRAEWSSAPRAKRTRNARNTEGNTVRTETTVLETTELSEESPPAQRRRLDSDDQASRVARKVESQGARDVPPVTRSQTATENQRKQRGAVRVEPEGKTLAELVRDLRRRVNTQDLEIRAIRKMRGRESAIIEVDGELSAAYTLTARIREAGHTAEISGERKARVYLVRLDPTITGSELCEDISRQLGAEDAYIKVVFSRENNNGTKAACIELLKAHANRLVKEGRLRIGWTETRVRLFETTDTCYRCGKTGQVAADCRKPINVCYNCGEPGHVKKDCPVPDESRPSAEIEPIEEEEMPPSPRETHTTTTVSAPERPKRVEPRGKRSNPSGKRVADASTQTDPIPGWPVVGRPTSYSAATKTNKTGTQRQTKGDRPQTNTMESTNAPQEMRETTGKARRTVALTVKIGDNTYEETVRALKSKVKTPGEAAILSIRRTRRGLTLIEVGSKEEAEEIKKLIDDALGEVAETRLLGNDSFVKIRGWTP